MTESTFRYTTPTAFRTALKERFGQIARTDRRYRLDEFRRRLRAAMTVPESPR